MEVMVIVGRKYVDFTDDSGKVIRGWSLYYTMQDDRTEGVMAGKMFISDQKASTLEVPGVGQKVECIYDRYGRPAKFVPCK